MADTPAEGASKFHRSAVAIAGTYTAGERQAALAVRKTIQGVAPARLRNVGKKGAKLGIRVGPNMGGGVLVQATGPWPIIERDTQAHLIGAGRRAESLAKALGSKRRVFIRFPGGDIRLGPIHHPGTKGQRPFARGVDLARPLVPRIIDKNVQVTLRKTFGF